MSRPTAIDRAFGVVLRDTRIKGDLSQEELAFRSDLSPTYVGQLERGLRSPSLSVVIRLAKALSQAPHELVRAAEENIDPVDK